MILLSYPLVKPPEYSQLLSFQSQVFFIEFLMLQVSLSALACWLCCSWDSSTCHSPSEMLFILQWHHFLFSNLNILFLTISTTGSWSIHVAWAKPHCSNNDHSLVMCRFCDNGTVLGQQRIPRLGFSLIFVGEMLDQNGSILWIGHQRCSSCYIREKVGNV